MSGAVVGPGGGLVGPGGGLVGPATTTTVLTLSIPATVWTLSDPAPTVRVVVSIPATAWTLSSPVPSAHASVSVPATVWTLSSPVPSIRDVVSVPAATTWTFSTPVPTVRVLVSVPTTEWTFSAPAPRTPASIETGLVEVGGAPGQPFSSWIGWPGPANDWPLGLPANQKYQLTLDATGGSFILTGDSGLGSTASIAWDADVATVRSTIQAAWGSDVLVTGEDLPDGPINIEFTGSMAAKRYVVRLA